MQIWKQSISEVNCQYSEVKRSLVCLIHQESPTDGMNIAGVEDGLEIRSCGKEFLLIEVEVLEDFKRGRIMI